jgi:hypothetical protein
MAAATESRVHISATRTLVLVRAFTIAEQRLYRFVQQNRGVLP